MAKLFTYIFLIVGLMALFNVAGLETPSSLILDVLNPRNLGLFKSTAFYLIIIGAITSLAAVGSKFSLGFYGMNVSETAVSAGAALLLFIFLGDLISIADYLNAESGWLGWLAYLIMIPIIFGYAITLIDWVKNHD